MVGAKQNRKYSQQTLMITASQRVRAKQAKASAVAVQLNATNVYTLFDLIRCQINGKSGNDVASKDEMANEYVKVE